MLSLFVESHRVKQGRSLTHDVRRIRLQALAELFPSCVSLSLLYPNTGLQQLWDIPQNIPEVDKEIFIEVSPLDKMAEAMVILTSLSGMLYNSEFLVKCITENWTSLVPAASYTGRDNRRDRSVERKCNSQVENRATADTKQSDI